MFCQPLQPHRPPAIADKQRIGRKAHRAEEEKGPFKSGREKRAAHVVRVVGVAIVGRADGDDRLQRRRTERRDLQPIEAAPGNSHHPDRAVAPGLRRQPGDHLHAVVLFLLGVLVEQQARRFAAAANVDANAGVAVTGQIGMGQRVPLVGAVALAVGQIFQDRRNRILSASSGSQMRAASVVPSFNGINMCSITRTALGKVVTITADHSMIAAACRCHEVSRGVLIHQAQDQGIEAVRSGPAETIKINIKA